MKERKKTGKIMCQEDETTGNGDPSCGEIDSSEEEECDPLDDTCPE